MIEGHILSILKAHGVSVAELALRMETSANQAYRLLRTPNDEPEAGKPASEKRKLTYEWLKRIADALGLTVGDLLPDADNPHRIDPPTMTVVQAFRAIEPAVQTRVAPMLQALAGKSDITAQEMEMLMRIRALDDASKSVMRRLIAA